MKNTHLSDGISGLPIPPGEILLEELTERGITQAAFAKTIRRPAQAVNEIVKGKKSITPETAIAFEKALGVSAELWINLEASYQLSKARAALRELRKVRRPAKAAS